MQESALKVKQLNGANPAAGKGMEGRSLLSVTDDSARSAGLGAALKRVEPDGSTGVRVWLEDASFDSVAGWLSVMDTHYGVDVDSATLERAATTGRINARLSLQASKP
jgi:general secretion pathway protein M